MSETTIPDIEIPAGVALVAGPNGLRLLGHAEPLIAACKVISTFAVGDLGPTVTMGEWTLSFGLGTGGNRRTVTYPERAWRVAAGVLIEVPVGNYRSPLDFGDVGFGPRSDPDVGVSLIGLTRYDLRRFGLDVPSDDIRLVDKAQSAFAEQGRAGLVRIDDAMRRGYVVDLVDLGSGEIADARFAAGVTVDEAIQNARLRLE